MENRTDPERPDALPERDFLKKKRAILARMAVLQAEYKANQVSGNAYLRRLALLRVQLRRLTRQGS